MVITVGHEADPARRIRKAQGGKLRQYRKLRGLTLREVAEAMNDMPGVAVTPQAIGQWELGNATPRPHMQLAVARALDFLPSAVFGLDAEAAA